MPIALFMALCLADTDHGYYQKQQPFGATGDFVTAPDVSQLFGELIGIYIILCDRALGSPKHLTLAEFGPGRGTLMKDALRAIRQIDQSFLQRANVILIETSQRLRDEQTKRLKDLVVPKHGNSVGDIPQDAPIIAIGNEFFDALPISQYVLQNGKWHERAIGVEGDDLCFTATHATLPLTAFPSALRDQNELADGTIYEVADARSSVIADISHLIASQTGFGLFADYGFSKPAFGDTLQAIKKHSFDPVLANPGEADLTSHVDFSTLLNTAKNQKCHGKIITQADFLLGLGLLERAGKLGAGKHSSVQNEIHDAVERLAGPDQMGKLFKFIGIAAPNLTLPTPFL